MFAYSGPNSWRAWDDKENLAEGEVFFDHEPSDEDLRRAFPEDFKRQENLRRVDSARQDILKKVEEITGVKITDRDVPLLEILFLSDDETKTKLVEHLKSFQKAKQA